jgi:hypothetical protein
MRNVSKVISFLFYRLSRVDRMAFGLLVRDSIFCTISLRHLNLVM